MTSGIQPLAGFFELWLRDVAAVLMGEVEGEYWRHHVQEPATDAQPQGFSQRHAERHEICTDSKTPTQFTLDKSEYQAKFPDTILDRSRSLESYPVADAWHSFVWKATHREVRQRFGEDHEVHLLLKQEPILEKSFSMQELYIHLFCEEQSQTEHQSQRHSIANALHSYS